jgi:predicted dehydrogenase
LFESKIFPMEGISIKQKLRLGVIGCGGFTSGKHLPNLTANPRYELRALCDLNKTNLDRASSAYRPLYSTADFKQVCADPEVDALLVGTKPSCRLPILAEAVHRGKHVFLEKPMSMEHGETLEIYRLLKSSAIQFMVGHNRPYSPIMRDTRELFRAARDTSAVNGNNTLILYRIVGEAQMWPEHHRSSIYRGESTIIHELTHIFDLLNWLIGDEPTFVFTGGAGNMDNVLTLAYPGNVTAVIISGDNGSSGFPKECLEINTNHCVISARSFIELAYTGEKIGHGRRHYGYKLDGKEQTSSLSEYEDLLWRIRSSITVAEKDVGYYYNRMPAENKGHYEELDAFYNLVMNGEPIASDLRKSALATLIALKAIESLQTRAPINLAFPELA